MKQIETREDIEFLVDTFYFQIQNDEILGPIFNKHIAPESWPHHLKKLTDFWQTNLFGIPAFKGNPTLKHVLVDTHLEGGMQIEHFERWLKIWAETIDEHFYGYLADRAKISAQKMAKGQWMVIGKNRN
ncbi:MAG: globin [Flavobacteriaceae bacterium]|nr:MAG: globin [Flavobacteriaceae bacterium]